MHVSVSGAQRNWRWQKVKEFVDATGLCGVCGVICNQRRHLRAGRGDLTELDYGVEFVQREVAHLCQGVHSSV